MGTNFYWIRKQEWMDKIKDIDTHIGKRSGAGLYCSKCRKTLCKGGKDHIHTSTPEEWYEVCPSCNSKDYLEHICSFTWTDWEHKKVLEEILESNSFSFKYNKLIVDEYGNKFTVRDFYEKEFKTVRYEFYDKGRFC